MQGGERIKVIGEAKREEKRNEASASSFTVSTLPFAQSARIWHPANLVNFKVWSGFCPAHPYLAANHPRCQQPLPPEERGAARGQPRSGRPGRRGAARGSGGSASTRWHSCPVSQAVPDQQKLKTTFSARSIPPRKPEHGKSTFSPKISTQFDLGDTRHVSSPRLLSV